jgi:hypothetical protein
MVNYITLVVASMDTKSIEFMKMSMQSSALWNLAACENVTNRICFVLGSS